MARTKTTVKFPGSSIAAVLEAEPSVISTSMGDAPAFHATPAPADVEDDVERAYAARNELIQAHENVLAEKNIADTELSVAENDAAVIAAAASFDETAFGAARARARAATDKRDGLQLRANAIHERGVRAEEELNRALAARNAIALAAEAEKYNRDVVETQDAYVASIRAAWDALGDVSTTDALSWIAGGIARSIYLNKMRSLTAQAKGLLNRGASINEPIVLGSGYANRMLQIGELPEKHF